MRECSAWWTLFGGEVVFADRVDAGRQLAEALRLITPADQTVVLGIPRGGVIVAAEVARSMGLPLDVAVAAKVGSPGNPEYAIGAVAADGEVSVNPGAGYSPEQVRALSQAAYAKVRAQLVMWREGREPLQIADRPVLLVDDGLATGLTAIAAAEWLHRQGAGRVVVAVPVAPPDTLARLRRHADEVVAVERPRVFSAVGQFYRDFGQTSDAEVRAALEAAG
jgi:predicted phosphoribosyltransferase